MLDWRKYAASLGVVLLAPIGMLPVAGSAAFATTYNPPAPAVEESAPQILATGIVAQDPIVIERYEVEVIAAPAVAVAQVYGSQDVSGIASNSAMVSGALRYLGAPWDCTALVEQTLRDMGYSVGDLAPMGFGGYGAVFYDPSQVQAGDIMMRGGHVAIYAGGGMAVHGGFGFGGVVYSNWDSNPGGYAAFVRVG